MSTARRRALALLVALPMLVAPAVPAAGPGVALAASTSGGASATSSAAGPPLGWSSWYHFGCGIGQSLFQQTARAMVSDGLRAAGYRYVDIDDCWETKSRGPGGQLTADAKRFPDGIKALADYVHARGLKLGIYLDTGTATCTGFPGSGGHEAADARTIAGWGVDALKLDFCRTRPAAAAPIYARWRRALDATGRRIMLQICEWGYEYPWTWAAGLGTTWRTTGDYPSYGAPRDYWGAILRILDLNAGLASYAHPGAYNDPNALLVGTHVLTPSEERAQVSLWAMLAAPLIAGGDLSAVSPATLAALENPRVLAVDQDPAALQGTRIVDDAHHQVWLRRLADGQRVLLFLNPTGSAELQSFSLSQLGLPDGAGYTLQDLWTGGLLHVGSPFQVFVRPHDVRMLALALPAAVARQR